MKKSKLRKLIGGLGVAIAVMPKFGAIAAFGVAVLVLKGEITMQELVATYYIDVILSFGTLFVCLVVCWAPHRRGKPKQYGGSAG